MFVLSEVPILALRSRAYSFSDPNQRDAQLAPSSSFSLRKQPRNLRHQLRRSICCEHQLQPTMTDKLPPNLLALFAPRPPLRWVLPADHAPEERKTAAISGLASFLPQLQEYKETDVYEPTESWLQRRDRIKLEKKENQERLLTQGPTDCMSTHLAYLLDARADLMVNADKPQQDPNIRGDAFKTLIVARLSYDATEQDLEREFGRFGPIERVCQSCRPSYRTF